MKDTLLAIGLYLALPFTLAAGGLVLVYASARPACCAPCCACGDACKCSK